VTVITTLFPNKKRLSDSFNIENNDEYQLADGVGMYFGSGINSSRIMTCQYTLNRNVIITLTKAVYGGHKSLSILETAEKALLDDQHSLIKEIERNLLLDNSSPNRKYISDNGVERIIGDSKTFIMMQTVFTIEYLESLV
jgi:hypothetical protein